MTTESSIDNVIEQINSLNKAGIQLTGGPNRDLDAAHAKHQEAATLCLENEAGLNPDYYAFSSANQGYCLRQQGDRDNALEVLNAALTYLDEKFIVNGDATFGEMNNSKGELYGTKPYTKAGRARVFEEIGLVHRFFPSADDPITDLNEAIKNFDGAHWGYFWALDKPDNEIIDAKQITNKLNGVIGARAMTLLKLSTYLEGEEKEGTLQRAFTDTQEYINLREEEYEQDTIKNRREPTDKARQDLADAYHAQTIIATEIGEYDTAWNSLECTQRLTTSDRTQTTLLFRAAWLYFKEDPKDEEPIKLALDDFLSKVSDKTQTRADLNNIKDGLLELGDNLEGNYQTKIDNLYQTA